MSLMAAIIDDAQFEHQRLGFSDYVRVYYANQLNDKTLGYNYKVNILCYSQVKSLKSSLSTPLHF